MVEVATYEPSILKMRKPKRVKIECQLCPRGSKRSVFDSDYKRKHNEKYHPHEIMANLEIPTLVLAVNFRASEKAAYLAGELQKTNGDEADDIGTIAGENFSNVEKSVQNGTLRRRGGGADFQLSENRVHNFPNLNLSSTNDDSNEVETPPPTPIIDENDDNFHMLLSPEVSIVEESHTVSYHDQPPTSHLNLSKRKRVTHVSSSQSTNLQKFTEALQKFIQIKNTKQKKSQMSSSSPPIENEVMKCSPNKRVSPLCESQDHRKVERKALESDDNGNNDSTKSEDKISVTQSSVSERGDGDFERDPAIASSLSLTSSNDSSHDERLQELIKRGPCQPILQKFPRNKIGRAFNGSWYRTRCWLEYSTSRDTMFCFACRIFSSSKNSKINHVYDDIKTCELSWIDGGVSNWKKGVDKMKRHETSDVHLRCMEQWSHHVEKGSTDSILNFFASSHP